MADAKCQYCWRPTQFGGHNEGCPIEIGTPEAMTEWERGYAYGWEDNIIHMWEYDDYLKCCPTFFRGWLSGKSAIDQLVDDAAQRNFSFHRGEY